MVMKLNGTSWAAVGWRPKGLTASCKKFPVLADPVEPVARSIDFGESEASAAAEPEPSPAAQVQPREGRAKKVEKRMTTSVDVGISYVMSSISSSRTKRAAETKEEVKRRLRENLVKRRRFQRAFAIPLDDENTSPAPRGKLELIMRERKLFLVCPHPVPHAIPHPQPWLIPSL